MMGNGTVQQRHHKSCPRDDTGEVVEHRCRGPWRYVLDLPHSPSGRREQITRGGFATRGAARAALDEARRQVRDGILDPRITTGEYLEQWLKGKRALRPSTLKSYRAHLDQDLIPVLGRVRLTELRARHVDQLLDHLAASPRGRPLAPASIRRVHATLRTALNAAVRRRLIPYNPAVQVDLPEERRDDVVVWTPDQVNRFLDSSAEDRLHALYLLVIITGLRRGEAVGLRWVDVDLDRARMRVTQQIVELGRTLHVGPPKTKAGARTVPLDSLTAQALRAHQRQQTAERVAWAEGWTDTGLVFGYEDGTTLSPEHVTRRFRALAVAAGLPVIRFHGLRHTSASLALEAGVPMKVVSERLGHSTTGITADLYTHVSPAVSQDAADAIARLLDRSGRPGSARGVTSA